MSTFCEKYGPWAVVTGASGGLGKEFCAQLAERNLNIVLSSRSEDKLEDAAKQLEDKYHIKTACVSADLTSEEGLKKLYSVTDELDVGLLVNNAGLLYHGSFFHFDFGQHAKLIDLNITSVTALAHVFGKRFIKRGKGGILFVSSAAKKPMPWLASYSASKAYVANLAYILASEMSSYGVQVMSLEPGLIETDMTEDNLMNLDMPSITPQVCVEDALSAFENKLLRTTPEQDQDRNEAKELLEQLNSQADKIKSQMDGNVFEPKL